MRNVANQIITNVDGVDQIFAYYRPNMKDSKDSVPTPLPAKPKLAAATAQSPEKRIELFVTEVVTGDAIQLPNVAEHGEAIEAAHKLENIPDDWIVTVIESKPTVIKMARAAPSYGLISPEKYHEVQQRQVTALSSAPKLATRDESVMVKMIYAHIDKHRKTIRRFQNHRVYNDQSRQELLEMWIERARNERVEPWSGIARKISTPESDYHWFTGNDNDLVFPWYDQETIVF
jgi:hypothetical protein